MSKAAELIVKCLENEGVEVVFGLPGEENIRFVRALAASSIRYVLTRHEQAASFMAEMYGRVTGRAAVVSSTLGPGAINMQLGVADATTNSSDNYTADANIGNWPNVMEAALKLDPRFVLPGHGPSGGPEVLKGQAQFMRERPSSAA